MASQQSQSASSAPSSALNVTTHAGAVWVVLLGGVLLVAAADYAPHLVNGALLLLLTGVILRRSDVWSGWVSSVGQNLGSGS